MVLTLGKNLTDVSVVIPSTGRQELRRAIASARMQAFSGGVEIVVAFDLHPETTEREILDLATEADIVVFTGGGRKGGAARNLGVKAASGDWIAFLDDDDEWEPEKLSLQLADALREKSYGKSPVVGCRVKQVVNKELETHVLSGVPARLITSTEKIEDYLFLNRRPGAKRSSFFTSTVIAERSLCEKIPWDESLARHQDWDWLIRASRDASVVFRQTEQDLVRIHVGSTGSISAGGAWDGSLKWATNILLPLGGQVFVDFVTAQTLRYALQRRDWRGVRRVLGVVLGTKRFPSIGPVIIGAAGLLPRVTLQNLMRRIR